MTEQDNATLSEDTTAEIEEKTGENAPRKAKNFWPSAKRLFGLLAPFKAQLWAIAAMNIICVFLAVAAPKVMGMATDVIFSGVISRQLPAGVTKDQAIAALRAGGQEKFADMASAMDLHPGFGIDFSKLGTIIGIVIAMYVVSSFFQWWQGFLLNSLVMKVVFDLRENIEAKLNRLPLNYFDTQSRGDLLSRAPPTTPITSSPPSNRPSRSCSTTCSWSWASRS